MKCWCARCLESVYVRVRRCVCVVRLWTRLHSIYSNIFILLCKSWEMKMKVYYLFSLVDATRKKKENKLNFKIHYNVWYALAHRRESTKKNRGYITHTARNLIYVQRICIQISLLWKYLFPFLPADMSGQQHLQRFNEFLHYPTIREGNRMPVFGGLLLTTNRIGQETGTVYLKPERSKQRWVFCLLEAGSRSSKSVGPIGKWHLVSEQEHIIILGW